jgi:hypothetical protein
MSFFVRLTHFEKEEKDMIIINIKVHVATTKPYTHEWKDVERKTREKQRGREKKA